MKLTPEILSANNFGARYLAYSKQIWLKATNYEIKVMLILHSYFLPNAAPGSFCWRNRPQNEPGIVTIFRI